MQLKQLQQRNYSKAITAKQLLRAVTNTIKCCDYSVVSSVGRDRTIEICCERHSLATAPLITIPAGAHGWNNVDIN